MTGFVSPGEENLRDPFQLSYGDIRTDFLPELPDQRFSIGLAKGHMAARECIGAVVRRLLQQHHSILHADARHPVAEYPVLCFK